MSSSAPETVGHPVTVGVAEVERARQAQRRKRQRDVLESAVRQVRQVRHARTASGHEASHVRGYGSDQGGMGASSEGMQDRRRALKRIIDDVLVEEAASRRKVHAVRVQRDRDTCVETISNTYPGRSPDGLSSGTQAHGAGQQPPYREAQQDDPNQHRRRQQYQQDGDLHLTNEEYLEMILRLEEELYQDFHEMGMGDGGDQRCWDEMEDMDAAEIDAMVEAHLGDGFVDGAGVIPDGQLNVPVPCPVCRHVCLQAHPGNPYMFFCPDITSPIASGSQHAVESAVMENAAQTASRPSPQLPAVGVAVSSLHPDEILHYSHCALDLSSEGIRLDQVGARVRVCEHAHGEAHPECPGIVRFEMREGACVGGPRMLVALCDGCGWGDVCV